MLGLVFHPLLGAHDSAAEEGRKVVLLMLATGLVFVLVIALGDLSHWVGKQRRRDKD